MKILRFTVCAALAISASACAIQNGESDEDVGEASEELVTVVNAGGSGWSHSEQSGDFYNSLEVDDVLGDTMKAGGNVNFYDFTNIPATTANLKACTDSRMYVSPMKYLSGSWVAWKPGVYINATASTYGTTILSCAASYTTGYSPFNASTKLSITTFAYPSNAGNGYYTFASAERQ